MRRWVAILGFCLVACSQTTGNPIADATPSPAKTATPSPSPSATLTADLPLMTVDFHCQLPVIDSSNSGADPFAFNGAFVSFPTAVLTSDPAGGIHLDSNGELTTDASPTLHSSGLSSPPFYDRAQRRWVPAASFRSTPDGASYAYVTSDASRPTKVEVHIVDVRSAAEKLFQVAIPRYVIGFEVFDFSAAGIYLVGSQVDRRPAGVWLMNPASGAIRPLVNAADMMAVRYGYGWLGRLDPRDPAPPKPVKGGQPFNSIIRVDLATGVRMTWFYRPGAGVELMGFDGKGRPVVSVFDPSGLSGRSESRLVTAPGEQGILIYAGTLSLGPLQGDGDRLWFGGSTGFGGTAGIYLYTQARGLQKVFAFTGGKPDHVVTPVGPCE